VRDVRRGVFTDPARVHPIEHDGEHFTVPGIHLCEPSPQRTPVIYQAGGSPRGRRFAAEHAESIFTGAPTTSHLATITGDIRAKLREAGRDPRDARIYTIATVIVDETDAKARAKHDELQRLCSDEAALATVSGWMGFDLSRYDLDDPIEDVDSNAIQGVVAGFRAAENDGRDWTVRDVARWAGIGGMGPVITGGPAAVADELQRWVQEADVDGFNLAYAITPGTFADIVEHLVPELQRRGLHRSDYEPGTLREKLLGEGPRLPTRHRGARMRLTAPTGREVAA
jgi:FMN-dependent oxidoreductase (nitrilotriacetate monooxygenase family)